MSTYIHVYKAELIKKFCSILSKRCSSAEKGSFTLLYQNNWLLPSCNHPQNI